MVNLIIIFSLGMLVGLVLASAIFILIALKKEHKEYDLERNDLIHPNNLKK